MKTFHLEIKHVFLKLYFAVFIDAYPVAIFAELFNNRKRR